MLLEIKIKKNSAQKRRVNLSLGYIAMQEALPSITMQIYNNLLTISNNLLKSVFIKYFSEERTAKYFDLAGDSAIDLYSCNLRLSQSFYPLLHILEVVLRNKINIQLQDFYHEENWILSEEKVTNLQYEEIKRVKNFLKNNNTQISSGKVISELNFSFWTAFFSTQTYKFYQGQPIKIFGKLPQNFGRKEVYIILNQIRKFRNRIYHNEPACFKNNSIDFSTAELVYEDILFLLNLLCPELEGFIAEHNRVKLEIEFAKQQF